MIRLVGSMLRECENTNQRVCDMCFMIWSEKELNMIMFVVNIEQLIR